MNVNQPVPDSRSLANPFTNHTVGHAYLTLLEQLPNGNVIVRNIGFYPKNYAKAGKPIDQSSFGDDSYTTSSVSLKISTTANEFNTLIANIITQEKLQYDLNSYNCTTSIIDALRSININLPSTIASTGLFNGNSPSNIGQDIRQLNLRNFSSENNGRKVVRTINEKNVNMPIERQGECQ